MMHGHTYIKFADLIVGKISQKPPISSSHKSIQGNAPLHADRWTD